MRVCNRLQVLLASVVLAIGGVTWATPGEMFPIDIVLTADYTILCVSHVDDNGDPWFIAEINHVHPDLPPPPFEQGFQFRVTGQYCLSCVDVFCGSFNGFIFAANLVPVVKGDVDGDGYVDVFDLVGVIERFGDPCPQESFCPADLDEDGRVGAADLVLLLINMR